MTRRWGLVFGALVALVSACEKAEPAPTPTPDQTGIAAASTLFAPPTRAAHPTPTITPVNDVELDLNRVVALMEQAVLAGDVAGYMAHVWRGDPVFLAEHTRWADDWRDHPLGVFEIELYGIQSLGPDLAAARMTIRWSRRDPTGGSSGGATASVVFRREGRDWLLGGERWQTADADGFRLYYFADEMVDNSPQAQTVLQFLPTVYGAITREFDVVPARMAHLKMYDSAVTLQNWTRLSVPALQTWNAPGESIKLALGPDNTAPSESDVAREYARFALFELAGGNFPWWLEEGIAEYGGSLFRTLSSRNRAVEQIAALASAPPDSDGRLFRWDELEATPAFAPADMRTAINQSFTLVQYVTDSYGAAARNAWIRAIATDQTPDEACQAYLGVSFEALDAAWRAWLAAR